MINRIALTAVFTVSFLTYLSPEMSVSVQLVPLFLFAILVWIRVFFSVSVLQSVSSLVEIDGVIFVVLLSSSMVASSLASRFDMSLGYALLFAACLMLARVYMATVSLREVLEAFFWSGILCMVLFVPLSFSTLVQSVQTMDRFGYMNLETNTLAFVLAGYTCVMVWKFLSGGWGMRVLTVSVGIACLVLSFFTSSRGALVGILAGGSLGLGMVLIRGYKEQKALPVRWIVISAVVLLGTALFVHRYAWITDAYEFVDNVLAISNPARGVGSGFSGRFESWDRTIRLLSDGSWSAGRGIRSSDSLYPMIDNSYLVILYELGVVPLLLIIWRFLNILRKFIKAYFASGDTSQRQMYLTCTLLMVVLLVTNLAERKLFAVGNPYSLLALLIFAAPTWALSKELETSPNSFREVGNRSAPSFQVS